MSSESSIENIAVESLLDRTRLLREQYYRLVQISTTRLHDRVELTYSFDRQNQLVNLRLTLPALDPCVQSISSIYGCSVLYENELHDLFNVRVEGMALDFGGNFYKTAVKFPFGTVKPPAAKPPPKPTPAPAKPAGAAPVPPAAPAPAPAQ
jgi:ech hydrogenase subunit D